MTKPVRLPRGSSIRLEAEFKGTPLRHADAGYKVIDGCEIGLSEELIHAIESWNNRASLETLKDFDPWPEMTPEQREQYDAEGMELAKQISLEAGNQYFIFYTAQATGGIREYAIGVDRDGRRQPRLLPPDVRVTKRTIEPLQESEWIPAGQTVRIMAEICAVDPVWSEVGGTVSEALGISNRLCEALNRWNDWYNTNCLGPNNTAVGDPEFPTLEEAEEFDARGMELAKRVKQEVGDRYEIEYYAFTTGKYRTYSIEFDESGQAVARLISEK